MSITAIFLSMFFKTNAPMIDDSTIIYELHSTLLKSNGLLALNTNDYHVSIFNEFRIPQIDDLPSCEDYKVIKTTLDQSNSKILKKTRKYITKPYARFTRTRHFFRPRSFCSLINSDHHHDSCSSP